MVDAMRAAAFERARELSVDASTLDEADAAWRAVIRSYRAAIMDSPTPDRADQRQLARALWRHGMVLGMSGRAREGLTPARQAISMFEQLHQAVDDGVATAAERDEALAELITALVDLGEVSFAAGDVVGRLTSLERALALGLERGSPLEAGLQTRIALGTAFHNQATALLHRHLTGGGDLQEATLAGSRAVELRQNLVDQDRPLSFYEAANTYAVYAYCLGLAGDLDRARMVLQLGNAALAVIGPAGADIVPKMQAAAEVVERSGGPAAQPNTRRRWGRGR